MTSITVLGIPITFTDQSAMPYCLWIQLVSEEIGKVQTQIEALENRLNLPPFLVKREDQEALREAKEWYIEALKLWADWITAYNAISVKGKAELPIDRIVELYRESAIPDYHPSAEQQANVHLALRVGGLTTEEAIEAVMLVYRLCDCWEEQRAAHWKDVLNADR